MFLIEVFGYPVLNISDKASISIQTFSVYLIPNYPVSEINGYLPWNWVPGLRQLIPKNWVFAALYPTYFLELDNQ